VVQATVANRALKVSKVSKVHPETQVRVERLEVRVLLVHRDLLVELEQLDLQELWVPAVPWDQRVQLVSRDSRVRLGHLATKASRVSRVFRVQLDTREQRDLLDHLVALVLRVQLDYLDHRVQLASRVVPAQRVIPDPWDLRVSLAHLVLLDLVDPPETRV
jgi:hypothetical protein